MRRMETEGRFVHQRSGFQLKEFEFDPESCGKLGGDCQEPRLNFRKANLRTMLK